MVDQDDAANAPLIGGEEIVDSPNQLSSSHATVPWSRESQLTTLSPFIWALTISAGISGLLFGYEFETAPSQSLNITDLRQYWRHLLDSRIYRPWSFS